MVCVNKFWGKDWGKCHKCQEVCTKKCQGKCQLQRNRSIAENDKKFRAFPAQKFIAMDGQEKITITYRQTNNNFNRARNFIMIVVLKLNHIF